MSKIKTIKVEGVVYDIKAQYDGAGNNIETTYATKTEVDTRIKKIIGAAPEALDTLEEIAKKLEENGTDLGELITDLSGKVDKTTYDSEKVNFASKSEVNNKVDKAEGKGLSANDFTTLLKDKLDGIANSANNYTHPTTAGNKHIPAGGTTGQILVNTADGSASWSNSSSFLDGRFQQINESINSVSNKQTQLSEELQTMTANEELYCYGVEWDSTVASPVLTRIGNPLLHKSLPVQSAFRGCVANKNVINYYLYPDNWAFKADGVTPSVLDGTDGTVRVHTPKFYGKSGSVGNKSWVKISTVKCDSTWTEIPEMLIDAYRSTVDTTLTLKAVSVVNTTGAFRGGGNRTANDVYLGTDAFRSDLGKPRTNLSRANMRTYAVNAGSEMMCYEYYKWIFYWAYVIEYANFNSQATYNAELTSDGYRQGGLGDGVTTWNVDWNTYNGYYPLTPCGYCNEIGNFTGLKDLVIPGDAVTTKTFKVPRWRGFDNPFGDIWTNLDGIIIQGYTDEGTSTYNWKNVYTTTDPTKFGDAEAQKSQMKLTSNKETYSEGYTKAFDLKETAEIIPTTVGGGTTTYMCDYHYTGGKDTSLRTLIVGGRAHDGAGAGLGYFYSNFGVGSASATVGFRTLNKI